jgi:hypothetical protein
MPGTPVLGVSALSASDIWAFGPTAATAGLNTQDMIGMNWNGTSWSTLAVPAYTLSGQQTTLQAAVALGPANLWAVEAVGTFQPPDSGAAVSKGLVLAHWEGSAWSEVFETASDAYQGALTADGQGGIWFAGTTSSTGPRQLFHFSNGQLTQVQAPSQAGYSAEISAMALIRGPRPCGPWPTSCPRAAMARAWPRQRSSSTAADRVLGRPAGCAPAHRPAAGGGGAPVMLGQPGTAGVPAPRGRRVIFDPSQTSGSYLRPATRSFIGISALSVILMFSGQTSVQHLVMLQ